MSDAFTRAGIRPSAPSTSPAPEPVDPCADSVGQDLTAMIALLGESRTLRLLSEQAEAPYGKDRRASAITGAIQGARDRLPLAKSRAIADVRPASGRASDMADWLAERIDALQSGSYAAWRDAQQEDQRGAAATTAPSMGADEDDDAFRARFRAWADGQAVGVLRRLCPSSWGSDPDIDGAIRRQINARRDAERVAREAQMEADARAAVAQIRAAIVEGVALDDLRKMSAAMPIGWPQNICYEATMAVASSPQAWAEAVVVDVGAPPRGDPPQGWAALSQDAVARWAVGPRGSYGHRHPVSGAVAELVRRIGVGATLPHPDVTNNDAATLWLSPDGLAHIVGEGVPAHVTDRLGPAGWAEPGKDGRYTWCDPSVYAALSRVLDRARAPGTLDVSRVFAAFGRHPEKRYPRLWWSVWGRSSITVAVDDSLGPACDDLMLVAQHCPERVPTSAYWLHAEVRQTQAGGLRIAAARETGRAALITVQGHSQQLSRRSVGSTPSARSDSPALAVTGYAGSAKHRDVRVVACVSEGRPLLLDSGVGYRLGREPGTVERVPGLAEGRPGTPEAV